MSASARSTDPITSHEAAGSVRDLTERQDAVLTVLRQNGPSTDGGLIYRYEAKQNIEPTCPAQSESGIRTRRKELVERGLVRDSGMRGRTDSGRESIIWEVVPLDEIATRPEVPNTTPRQESVKERIKREHGVFVEAYTRIITKMNSLSDGFGEEHNESLLAGDRHFAAGVRYAVAEIQAELDKPRGQAQ